MPWSQLWVSLVVVKVLTKYQSEIPQIHHSTIEISWLNISRKSQQLFIFIYYRWICSKNNRARVNTIRVCVTVFLSRRGCNKVPEALFVQTNFSIKSRWYSANCRLEFTSCVAVTEQTSNKWLLLRATRGCRKNTRINGKSPFFVSSSLPPSRWHCVHLFLSTNSSLSICSWTFAVLKTLLLIIAPEHVQKVNSEHFKSVPNFGKRKTFQSRNQSCVNSREVRRLSKQMIENKFWVKRRKKRKILKKNGYSFPLWIKSRTGCLSPFLMFCILKKQLKWNHPTVGLTNFQLHLSLSGPTPNPTLQQLIQPNCPNSPTLGSLPALAKKWWDIEWLEVVSYNPLGPRSKGKDLHLKSLVFLSGGDEAKTLHKTETINVIFQSRNAKKTPQTPNGAMHSPRRFRLGGPEGPFGHFQRKK